MCERFPDNTDDWCTGNRHCIRLLSASSFVSTCRTRKTRRVSKDVKSMSEDVKSMAFFEILLCRCVLK